jgi:hypothetical protein
MSKLISEAVIEHYVSRPLIQTVAATQSSQSLIASEIKPALEFIGER